MGTKNNAAPSAAETMTPAVQALVVRNLESTLTELRANQYVTASRLAAVEGELARAIRGEW